MTATRSLSWLSFAGTSPRWQAWAATAVYLALTLVVATIDAPNIPSWVFPLYGVSMMIQSAILVRRFHDMGRSGWWAVATGLPILGLIPLIWALLARGRPIEHGRFAWRSAYSVGVVVLCLWGLFVSLRAVWVPFWIPSGSMKPALLPGDYVLSQRIRGDRVSPGDVVIFRSPVNDQVYVKRVIGLGGDTVDLSDGDLSVNSAPATYTELPDFVEANARQGPLGLRPLCLGGGSCRKLQRTEALPDGPTYPILELRPSPLDTFQTTVPDGHIVVMGDNRDNSIDSRLAPPSGLGPIPTDLIYARVLRIVFSSNGSLIDPRLWRPGRYWVPVP